MLGLKFLYLLSRYQSSAEAKIANVVAKSGAFDMSSIGKTCQKSKPPPTNQARKLSAKRASISPFCEIYTFVLHPSVLSPINFLMKLILENLAPLYISTAQIIFFQRIIYIAAVIKFKTFSNTDYGIFSLFIVFSSNVKICYQVINILGMVKLHIITVKYSKFIKKQSASNSLIVAVNPNYRSVKSNARIFQIYFYIFLWIGFLAFSSFISISSVVFPSW